MPVLASLGLIFAHHSIPEKMLTVSEFMSRIVWPIQETVNIPAYLVKESNVFFRERLNLLDENASLREQQILLQAQIQKFRALEAENQELRELLQSVGQEKESFFEARLIHVDGSPFMHQIMLNKGKEEGVEVGQPVIDSHGLVGVALAVNPHTSRVMLLTDSGFSVPVQSVRSGERAIATGSGTGGELRLNYVPRTADFVEGDQLVTSGLGGRFPAGYPVGVITSIHHDASTRFTLIGVSPIAKIGQLRHLLFVKNQAAAFKKPEKVEPTVAASTIEGTQINAITAKAPPMVPLPAQAAPTSEVPAVVEAKPKKVEVHQAHDEDDDDDEPENHSEEEELFS